MIYDYNYLNAIEENIIDLCKLKTFSWIQYLKNKNEIKDIVEFYDKEEIYISYEKCMKYIKFYSLNKNSIFYEIILNYKENYFFYKILYDEILKKKNNKPIEFIIPEKIKNKSLFFYNEIISFKKSKEEEVDNYFLEKCNINIKFLFKSEIKINRINLITKYKYDKIKISVNSDYNNEIINKKQINHLLNNITFFFFYHYELMPLSNIYGFIFFNNNLSSLLDIDYFFVNSVKK